MGYYGDSPGRVYVRARYLRPSLGRWLTVDSLWPNESAYSYALMNPVTYIDKSGLKSCAPRCDCPSLFYINKGIDLPEAQGWCPGGYSDCHGKDYTKLCNQWLEKNAASQCSLVRERLVGLISKCNSAGGGKLRKGDRVAAITLCCGAGTEGSTSGYRNSGEFCGIYCCDEFFKSANPCVKKCVMEHENRHKEDCLAHTNPLNDVVPESCPYLIEIMCLHETFAMVCGWNALENEHWAGLEGCKSKAGDCARRKK